VRGDIPLWFGGGAEAALRRAARTGDGFVFGSVSSHTYQRAARLRALLAECGRDPDRFPMETMIDYSLGPGGWQQQASAWEESGGSILSIRTMSTGAAYHGVARVELPDPDSHIAALGEFAAVARG
jgi:alkanesulfonate monooxygenase SsuD/methylene tetrahydromethanopterin reductase-like flavin-dependent oxidoreductase (luciferase family)